MNAERRAERGVTKLRICDIEPNPAQPRRSFSPESLNALANSISEHGLLSPLVVRMVGAGKYELIAGERRMRALKILGREWTEAMVIPAFDADSAILALVENIQREELHFLDEADACRAILACHGIRQDELARRLARSPSSLANRLRLTRLTPEVKKAIMQSGLSERHARALLAVNDPEKQLEMTLECAKKSMTVRALEQKICKINEKKQTVKRLYKDSRLYVNAVLDTVNRLEQLGARIEASVHESDAGTEITLVIKPI